MLISPLTCWNRGPHIFYKDVAMTSRPEFGAQIFGDVKP